MKERWMPTEEEVMEMLEKGFIYEPHINKPPYAEALKGKNHKKEGADKMMPLLPKEFIPYVGPGLKLKEDAPEEIKQRFQEWLKALAEIKEYEIKKEEKSDTNV